MRKNEKFEKYDKKREIPQLSKIKKANVVFVDDMNDRRGYVHSVSNCKRDT